MARQANDYPRLEGQVVYYSATSESAKTWHLLTKLSVLVLGASVPVLTVALNDFKLPVAIAGALVVVIEGARGVFAWHENWLSARATSEGLKEEQSRYVNAVEPYDVKDPDALKLLISRVEALMAGERDRWQTRQMSVDAEQ